MTVAAAAAAATAAGTAAAAAAVPAFDDHGNYLNLRGYPPAPVTWLTATVDTICRFARCRRWRDSFGITAETHPWLAQEVPPLSSSFPPFLRYTDYVVRRQQQQQQQQDDEHYYYSSTRTNYYLSLKHLYSYAFETPSTNLGLLTSTESCVTLFLLVWILRGLKKLLLPIFCEWGKLAARNSYSRSWAERNQARIDKFGEYVFRLMYHGAITVYGVAYFLREPFWHGNTIILFEGFPRHDVPPKLAWYYLLQAAYNVDALVSLLELSFSIQWRSKREETTTTTRRRTRTTTTTTTTTTRSWWSHGSTCQRQPQEEENHEGATTTTVLLPCGGWCLRGAAEAITTMTTMIRRISCDSLLSQFSSCLRAVRLPRIVWSETVRGDFREMFVHHLVTNMLIVGSSYCRLTRSGSMVFFVHDVSDVPVDLSKLANFLKWKKTTIACFCCMVITWMVFRLYVLPVTIFGSILTESHYILLPDRESGEQLPVLLYVCYRHLFYSLMVFLMLLHVAWFFMFLKMAYTIAVKYECHDYSEYKQGESSSSSSVSSSSKSKSKKHTTTKATASALAASAVASTTTMNGYHCNGSSSKTTAAAVAAAAATATAAADHSTTAVTLSNGKHHHYGNKKDE